MSIKTIPLLFSTRQSRSNHRLASTFAAQRSHSPFPSQAANPSQPHGNPDENPQSQLIHRDPRERSLGLSLTNRSLPELLAAMSVAASSACRQAGAECIAPGQQAPPQLQSKHTDVYGKVQEFFFQLPYNKVFGDEKKNMAQPGNGPNSPQYRNHLQK